jgi:hypothetical protein
MINRVAKFLKTPTSQETVEIPRVPGTSIAELQADGGAGGLVRLMDIA